MIKPVMTLDPEAFFLSTAEKRLVIRLTDYWKILRGEQSLPSLQDFDVAIIPDFEQHCFTLDCKSKLDRPVFRFAGGAIVEDCGFPVIGKALSKMPKDNLIAHVIVHWSNVIARREPIRFEGEHVNNESVTRLFRGILMPFSEDGENISCIVGAISWREVSLPTTAVKASSKHVACKPALKSPGPSPTPVDSNKQCTPTEPHVAPSKTARDRLFDALSPDLMEKDVVRNAGRGPIHRGVAKGTKRIRNAIAYSRSYQQRAAWRIRFVLAFLRMFTPALRDFLSSSKKRFTVTWRRQAAKARAASSRPQSSSRSLSS